MLQFLSSTGHNEIDPVRVAAVPTSLALNITVIFNQLYLQCPGIKQVRFGNKGAYRKHK